MDVLLAYLIVIGMVVGMAGAVLILIYMWIDGIIKFIKRGGSKK